MSKESIKSLRKAAEALAGKGIKTAAILTEALPVLMDLVDATNSAQKHLKECKNVIETLEGQCTAYAVAHHSVFEDKRLVPDQSGACSGDIKIDDRTFHLSCGYNGYIRLDSALKLTQDFLETLPEGWAKTRMEIDTTAINAQKVTPERLAEFGLQHKPNNVWTEKL